MSSKDSDTIVAFHGRPGAQMTFDDDKLSILSENDVFRVGKEPNMLHHMEIAKSLRSISDIKSLEQKNSGKFYTPQTVSETLILQTLKHGEFESRAGKLRIIDPFCGDGRLIAVFLNQTRDANLDLEIHLWDYDEAALTKARINIESLVSSLGIIAVVYTKKVDSFTEFFNGWEGGFDLVVTNPPWEVIKPDPKEISQIKDQVLKEIYIARLKEFSNRISKDFPISNSARTYGGWGVNLARVGTEISIRLAKDNGVVAIVAPSALLADQSSLELRRWMFATNALKSVNIYPSELRLFANVDQPFLSLVLRRGLKQKTMDVAFFESLEKPIFNRINNIEQLLITNDQSLPISILSDRKHLEILSLFNKFTRLSDLEANERIWIGRELDETNHRSWLITKGAHRFIKGRDINRFITSSDDTLYVNEEVLKKKIPKSAEHHRLVWRDVSRPNQKRRMIATVIPPGCVTGNSLGVLYFTDLKSTEKLLAYLGLMSSFVFEFQLRARLATAHVSAGVLRKIRVPKIDENFVKSVSGLVNEVTSGCSLAEERLEVYIAKAYGLNNLQFHDLLKAFPKVSSDERSTLLNEDLWIT